VITPVSSTTDIVLRPVIIYTQTVMRGTDSALTDKTGFSLSAAGNTAVIDEFETQSNTDPTGFKVNVMEVNGTSQTANDNGADINEILTDTGSTLDTLIKDIPTTAEIALRTLLAADYTVVGDLGTVQTGDSFAIVNGDHGLVSIQDDVDEILTDTAEIGTAGVGLSNIGTIATCTTNTDMRGTDGVSLVIPDASGVVANLISALNNISVSDITGVEVDNDGTTISLAGALKLILSVLAGKSSGGGTATIVFRDIADAKNRISATVDANGNRTAIGTRDAS